MACQRICVARGADPARKASAAWHPPAMSKRLSCSVRASRGCLNAPRRCRASRTRPEHPRRCWVLPARLRTSRRVLQHESTDDLDRLAERDGPVVRDVNGQLLVPDDHGPVGPDDHRAAGSEAAADVHKATTTFGEHPGISGLRDEDGDLTCRDDLAAQAVSTLSAAAQMNTTLRTLTPAIPSPSTHRGRGRRTSGSTEGPQSLPGSRSSAGSQDVSASWRVAPTPLIRVRPGRPARKLSHERCSGADASRQPLARCGAVTGP
jgi:hypothetical protein